MRIVLALMILSLVAVLGGCSARQPKIEQLQGSWWSDPKNPTADFAIQGAEVWLDFDSQYHPCTIVGDTLVFELGDGRLAKNRIISLEGARLVLESPLTKERTTLTRTE